MHVAVNDLARYIRPVNTSGGEASSWASSAASTADQNSGHIDRMKLGKRYRNLLVALPIDSVLGVGAKFQMEMGLQDAPMATGPWAECAGAVYGTTQSRVTQVVGGACSSGAGPTLCAAFASFNLQQARRFVRAVWNWNLVAGVSSSGQSGVIPAVFMGLMGGEEVPVDAATIPTSST